MNRRLAAAVALCLAAAPAWAVRSTTSSGLCLWWSTRQVHYAVNDFSRNAATQVCGAPASGAVFAAVQASFDTWGQATRTGEATPCTDLNLVQDGPTPSTVTGLDCQNLVVFRRGLCSDFVPPSDPCRLWDVNGGATVNCADKHNCWDADDPSHADSSHVIALTTVSYVASTGEIVDADMELNAWDGSGPQAPAGSGFYFTCVDPPAGTDVQNVVTHEAGHVLGLAHAQSQNCYPTVLPTNAATMCSTAVVGETDKRTLAADDVSGICAIYPAGAPTSVCFGSGEAALRSPSTCEQPSTGCGCGTAGAEGWLGLVALLAWRRRRG